MLHDAGGFELLKQLFVLCCTFMLITHQNVYLMLQIVVRWMLARVPLRARSFSMFSILDASPRQQALKTETLVFHSGKSLSWGHLDKFLACSILNHLFEPGSFCCNMPSFTTYEAFEITLATSVGTISVMRRA